MTDPVIELRGVSKLYQLGDSSVHALQDIDLRIDPGEFVAIMGASGSGKSTLMNILGCLDHPTTGDYQLEGIPVARLAEPVLAGIRSRRIGFVFQSFNLLSRTSALENVALPLFYAGLGGASLLRAKEALALLGLSDRTKNHPNQLSGGQQQRVSIARALVNQPAILLADEPTGNLDSQMATDIMTTIRQLNRDRGLTVILVTHEPEMARFADRIVTLRDGKIISDSRQPSPALSGEALPRSGPAPVDAIGRIALWPMAGMALQAAWRAIGRNKLRSVLTMLGIFVGVAALIAMLAVGEGARAAVKAQLESLGTDLLVVLPGSSQTNGARGGSGSASSLKVVDAAAILEEDSAVADVAYVNRQSAELVNGDESWSTSVQGVTPSFLSIRNWPLVAGRPLSDDDEHDGRAVCILGQTVVENLFGEDEDPIGATVLVKEIPMEVVGVLARKGHSAGGQDQDDLVLIPFSTSQARVLGVSSPGGGGASSTLGSSSSTAGAPRSAFITPANPFNIQPKLEGYVQTMYVQARSSDLVSEALDEVTQTLERRHRIKAGQDDDFSVRNLTEIAAVAEESSRVMELLLAAIASISLIVGGIGIMNILLVSVTERTREIGIRVAIGARRVHILCQFLVEAVLLSLLGGGAGVVVGVGASYVISMVAGWPILLDPVVLAGAFVFSAAIGIFFGFYPARQAANLNPIDALRYE